MPRRTKKEIFRCLKVMAERAAFDPTLLEIVPKRNKPMTNRFLFRAYKNRYGWVFAYTLDADIVRMIQHINPETGWGAFRVRVKPNGHAYAVPVNYRIPRNPIPKTLPEELRKFAEDRVREEDDAGEEAAPQ